MLPDLRPDLESDRRDQPSVVGFFCMNAAPVGIEFIRITVGAMARPFASGNSGVAQAF